MTPSSFFSFNRRNLARTALFGGASALLSAGAFAAPQTHGQDVLDARQLGAAGDGKTDDTAALQRALDRAGERSGAVFLAPGVYLTRELHVRAGTALTGVPAWNYSGPGGSVLQLTGTESTCLLDLTEARGATVQGLALDGGYLGANIHGIATNRTAYGAHEDGFRIETCQVARFTGTGMNLSHVWCFSVRHCEMMANHGDGMNLRGWDGFILDNWFSGNGRAGFAAREENASVTFTANRVEWNNEENVVIVGGDGYQITGNFLDRAGTVGLALRRNPQNASWNKGPCVQFTITGNFIKRSGKLAEANSHESAQVLLDQSEGVTFVGNTLESGRDDGDKGVWSPAYGIVYRGLKNCVVANNVLHKGALRELLTDLGGAAQGAVVKDNPGQLFEPGH